MPVNTILWRRLDQPGHDAARLTRHVPFWQFTGTAVFAHEREACRLDYQVVCDSEWRTLHAKVVGWVGPETISVDLYSTPAHGWIINGVEAEAVAGCVDLDLAFSPITNTIPIRRLALPLGRRAEVRSAWLEFPSFALSPLEQSYLRSGESTYHYESPGSDFTAELEVNAAGLVLSYPPLFEAVLVACPPQTPSPC